MEDARNDNHQTRKVERAHPGCYHHDCRTYQANRQTDKDRQEGVESVHTVFGIVSAINVIPVWRKAIKIKVKIMYTVKVEKWWKKRTFCVGERETKTCTTGNVSILVPEKKLLSTWCMCVCALVWVGYLV